MSFSFVIKEGLSGIRKAFLSALGSILTITFALILLGCTYLIALQTAALEHRLRAQIEIEAFVRDDLPEERIGEMARAIRQVQGVDSIRFISKAEAAQIFRSEFGEDISSVLDYNPLPPSFRIMPDEDHRRGDSTAAIVSSIAAIDGIESAVYRNDFLQIVDKGAGILNTVGLGLGLFITLSAVFLVANTIRLTILARKKTIQTMKLVGATWWFVRVPFLIEGLIQGLCGGVLAAGVFWYLDTELGELLRDISPDVTFMDIRFYAMVLMTGVVLGLLGSAISIKRFIGETVDA